MSYFFKVKTTYETYEILKRLYSPLPCEWVNINNLLGRVVAEDVRSAICLPGFERSAMDGFAVIARDTFGASIGSPAYLNIIGEVKVGEATSLEVSTGNAVRVSTGSMLPLGADAVVMFEYVDFFDDRSIVVMRSVAPGDNIVGYDEDVRVGDIILSKGGIVCPQDIGALAGCGISSVKCYCKPKVAIISSGDEIVSLGQVPKMGQIWDINSFSLSALTCRSGGIPINMGVVSDSFDMLRSMVNESLGVADIVVISGGSSIGTRDVTLDVIRSFNNAEVLVHGISIKPGKPTIIAKLCDKFIFGLPGNPVSVIVTFELFVNYLIRLMSGINEPLWYPIVIKAKLSKNIASAPGREDYVCVKLIKSDEGFIAEPVFGKSALISMMLKADGLIKIPLEDEGLEAGTDVDVSIIRG